MNICKCGCGGEIIIKKHHKSRGIPIFIKGHFNKGKKLSDEYRLHISQNHYNVSENNNPMFGKKHSVETRLKQSDKAKLRIGVNHPRYNSKHTSKTKKLIGLKSSNRNQISNQKIGDAARKRWKNSEYREKSIKNMLKGLSLRPVSSERKLNIILQQHFPNEWKYTGDGSFLIGYKNPDFININGRKICIEIYYPYFKIRDFGSCENYETKRSEHFAKYGWNTIFIQFKELNNEELIKSKINTPIDKEYGFIQ